MIELNIFSKLFSKKQSPNKAKEASLPRAVAFVDYEHWYFSMENLFHTRPDIGSWVDNVRSKAVLTELVFFADFGKFRDKSEETRKIREYTNRIIDTFNPDQRLKKDYTDFIMLDHIYQRANDADNIDMFIIFTGDGHFSSVASYLKNIRRKQLGIYGVKGAVSHQLMNIADWTTELPEKENVMRPYMMKILQSLKINEERGINRATYYKTIQLISTRENTAENVIEDALKALIEEGYVTVRDETSVRGYRIQGLYVDWDRAVRDSLVDGITGYMPPINGTSGHVYRNSAVR